MGFAEIPLYISILLCTKSVFFLSFILLRDIRAAPSQSTPQYLSNSQQTSPPLRGSLSLDPCQKTLFCALINKQSNDNI